MTFLSAGKDAPDSAKKTAVRLKPIR